MALREAQAPLPAQHRLTFQQPVGATYGDAAAYVMQLMAPQKLPARPDDFPRRRRQDRPEHDQEQLALAAE